MSTYIKKMPRKMKKRRRKELELDWKIASYEPFGNLEILGDFFK